MRRLIALVVLVALLACAWPASSLGQGFGTAPLPAPALGQVPELPTTVRFYPPEIYEHWWAQMEACTGRRGYMWLWHFRVTPKTYIRWSPDSLYYVIAETRWPARVMVFTAPRMLTESTVKHEFIHALGQYGHDYRVFVTACKVETDVTIKMQDNPYNLPPHLVKPKPKPKLKPKSK